MKVTVNFQRRYSVMITIIACAAAIFMLVKRFGFPKDQLMESIWITLSLLMFLIVVAVPIALVIRWLADRRDQ